MQFELLDITTCYPQSGIVLDQINLQIEKGDIIGIVGRTGSGKTTLLEALAGLHPPKSGKILFEGKDIYNKSFNLNNFRKKVQIVFQFPEYQFFETNVRDEIAFGLKMKKVTTAEIEERTHNILDLLCIHDHNAFLSQSPFTLSGGQKRRLALACSLVIYPEVLLLDEPFAGLDSEGIKNITQLLSLERNKGTTIIVVCHDPNILCEFANKIIVLSNGIISLAGKPSEIYNYTNFSSDIGIGMPYTKMLADRLELDLSDDLSYKSFIDTLESSYGRGLQ